MIIIDELEDRVRYVESEVEGEKAVTRQVYQQAVRNGDALRAVQLAVVELTSRTDHIVQEVIQNTAAVRSHGARLDSLTRDVGQLRNDATELRRNIEAVNARLAQIEARLDRMQEELNTRFEGMNTRFWEMNTRFGETKAQLVRMEQGIAAILAAVAPGKLAAGWVINQCRSHRWFFRFWSPHPSKVCLSPVGERR
jgi:chromosome segregation ATPase